MTAIDTHLGRFAGGQRSALEATVATIRRALPGATEVISYGMPTFKVGGEKGVAVIGIDGFTAHNSLFPYSSGLLVTFRDALAGYVQTKGSIHFAVDRPFPAALLKRLLKERITQINAAYPKASGEVREFYDNGFPKSTGRLRAGEPVGQWVTYDRRGNPLRATTHPR